MVPNQHCCLRRHPYDDFLRVYMLVLFFTYGKNYRVFQVILFDIIYKIFNIAFWSVWKTWFSPKHVWTSSTLVLILRFDKTSILFLFFVVFFLFVLTFFDGIISKVVAPRQIYTTIEGIKASIDSLLIFLNVLLLVTSTLSQQFLLFLYMKSIACHIYHTFLKIP